ncbi:MAG TPA: NAD(P)-dependent oxidoreductase [Rhizomicrobium sp.]|nr:NAD(P)-dependent oxidoreductase [Rhizomicrobium sp.]
MGHPGPSAESRRKSSMKIGFIGLGQMGTALAGHLLRAGHTVTVWNRSPRAVETLAAQGATPAKTPAEAMQCNVLFSMLASDQAIRDVGLDASLLDKAGPGLVHVNMATISPGFAEALAAAHDSRGLDYVAAPVFARPDAAAKGQAVIVVAGANDAVAKVEPLLTEMGRRLVKVGDKPQMANLFKIAGNFMIMSAVETLGETFALLKKGGVDATQFLDTMTEGLFAAPVYKNYGKQILAEAYEPAGFYLRLGLKDATLVKEASENLNVPMPLLDLVRRHYEEAMQKGWSEKDWASIGTLIAQKAGV